jgi:hypothetical protein
VPWRLRRFLLVEFSFTLLLQLGGCLAMIVSCAFVRVSDVAAEKVASEFVRGVHLP